MEKFLLKVTIISIIVSVLIVTSCAPGNERWDKNINPGHKAGFWAGLWHGLILIITFVVSLFTKEVGIYEINNNGWPYNLGFILGLCFTIGAPWRWRPHRH